VLLRALRDLRDLELFDRAMTLAAQAFTSVLPVLIVSGQFRRRLNPDARAYLTENLSLDGRTAELVERSIPPPEEGVTVAQVIGTLLLIIAATSFARALERCFRKIWDAPKASIRFAWRWVAAILAIVIGLVIVSATRYVLRSAEPVGVLAFIVEAALWCLLWWLSVWIVVNRTVSLRALLPGSVLTGIGLAAATQVGRLYLPPALASSADQFGVLGLAFTYVGWLFVLMSVLLVAATIGRILHLAFVGRLWSRSGDRGAVRATTPAARARPSGRGERGLLP
jgi:membrane protein